MESNIKTARPYAIAAFKQAQDEGDSERWSRMLALIASVAGDAGMKKLIANPRVTRPQLASLIIDVCADELSDSGRNFVKVLAENKRLGISGDVASAFEAERARAERRSDVQVISAYELTAGQQNDINVSMTRRLGTKVDISVAVDQELIGGVIIRCGDMVIDASVRGRLAQLTQTLA
ncbi:MAG: F-type H+-transporting ATPase subunit delta [Gammaproteobacteria bacterium]|jgi:F-type H+-transporting ATPase subunit delta